MKSKTRREKLIEITNNRLYELNRLLVLPAAVLDNEEFEALKQEAVKLREVLKMLNYEK